MLNIGGEQLSEAAKELELAGKSIEKSDNIEENKVFIKSHHDIVMKLYGDTIENVKNILKESE